MHRAFLCCRSTCLSLSHPQLPRFFIERLTLPGDTVYDPFMGRGTTPIEAALRGRVPAGNDVNPLSSMLTWPRLRPPTIEQVEARLQQIGLGWNGVLPDDLVSDVVQKTLAAMASTIASARLEAVGTFASPLRGQAGNTEVFALLRHTPG